jgi:hypothetical protein
MAFIIWKQLYNVHNKQVGAVSKLTRKVRRGEFCLLKEDNIRTNIFPHTFQSRKNAFTIRSYNATQRSPEHVSSRTASSVTKFRARWGWCARKPQCEAEMPLRCPHESLDCLERLEDSNVAGTEASLPVPLENISYDRMRLRTIMHAQGSSSASGTTPSTNINSPVLICPLRIFKALWLRHPLKWTVESACNPGGGEVASALAMTQIVPHLRWLLVNALFHR